MFEVSDTIALLGDFGTVVVLTMIEAPELVFIWGELSSLRLVARIGFDIAPWVLHMSHSQNYS